MEIIVTTLIWAAVFQGFLLGIIFMFSKKHKSFSNKLLGLILITFIFGAISDLIPIDTVGNYDIAQLFSTPEVKWLFPVLFLHYVLEKIGRSTYFRKFLTGSYIIAFAIISITVFNVVLFLLSGNSIYKLFGAGPVESFYMIQQYCAFLYTVFIFILVLLETIKFRNIAKNEYSDYTLIAISWLWQFIFLMVPVILLWGTELVRILFGGLGQSDIVVVTWGAIAIFIYFVSFKAFTHQDLFYEKNPKAETRSLKKGGKIQKEKSGKSVCETVKNSMETEKFYLNQDLSIHDFAKEINVSARTISTCINKNFGFNFNEWVNNYRVENALGILQDKNYNHLSVEGVGSDSGFKSRSAMYIAFKKKTGKTPGYYRTI